MERERTANSVQRKVKSIRHLYAIFLTLYALRLTLSPAFGWGPLAHQTINREAYRAVPGSLKYFFFQNREYIAQHSMDPDNWKKTHPDERPRHFIDIDAYGAYPFRELPRDYLKAKEKYGEEKLAKEGIVPWVISWQTERLEELFAEEKWDEIPFEAAILGHYVADSHVPLHTTTNYDGQETGQQGIHKRWESDLVERYFEKLDPFPKGKPDLVKDYRKYAFSIVLKSHRYIDKLLAADKKAADWGTGFGYDEGYYRKLFEETGEVVEERMRAAAHALGSLWYSAWVNGGRPAIPDGG